MEYEFDKEMDSLLRKAQRERFISQEFNAHLDADEISLFAENALTKKARMRVTEHLADCTKCRKILSNVIVLNSEESSEIVHTEEQQIVASEAKIPWYRKLFVFPNLAYTMGGLTVLLAGLIGYVTLQNFNESKETSIAQIESSVERPRGSSGADSDGESVTVETYSTNTAVNAASAPVAANAAANVAAKSNVPAASSNSTAAAPESKAQPMAKPAATPSSPGETADDVKAEKEVERKETQTEPASPLNNAERAAQENYSRNSIARNQTAITPDSQSVQNRQIQNSPSAAAPMSVQQDRVQTAKRAAKPPLVNGKKDASEKSKSVGGKNFVFRNGVWYDKSYNQQSTVNVSRNSDDYKKLNSGLRSTANSLGGTVVIVWNGTAYRIQ